MKISIRKGVGFGLTSGIITTLGLVIGLASATNSETIIIAGILTIAIADSLSDALGVHISEESGSKKVKQKEIWESTIATFLTKLIIALTFLIPVLLFENLFTAIIISIIWGFLLIMSFSYYVAKKNNGDYRRAVAEHLFIAIIVIILTYFAGKLISGIF